MRIKEGFIKRCIAGQNIAVATGNLAEEFHGMVKLNDTAAFIWDQLDTDTSTEAVASALAAEYRIDTAKAKADTEKTLELLRTEGFLQE